VPNSVLAIKCGECYGNGLIFFGDNKDFHVVSCECEIHDELF
jgi:hypothetical protein